MRNAVRGPLALPGDPAGPGGGFQRDARIGGGLSGAILLVRHPEQDLFADLISAFASHEIV
jgi:hypothetical protein